MSYDKKKLPKIKADFESGRFKKMDMSKKWGMSRQTLNNLEKKHGWKFGKNGQKLNAVISKKATERIIKEETAKLVGYTARHLKGIGNLRVLSELTAKSLADSLRETKNKIPKAEADRIFAIQKCLKISSETLSIIYKDERLAMGLDNPASTLIKIGKITKEDAGVVRDIFNEITE